MKDEPKSAKANKDTWGLWKLCETLTLDEIKMLWVKRKQDLKYEKNPDGIKRLKTEMSILNDAYEIMKKRGK
jgi:hypothetical protein